MLSLVWTHLVLVNPFICRQRFFHPRTYLKKIINLMSLGDEIFKNSLTLYPFDVVKDKRGRTMKSLNIRNKFDVPFSRSPNSSSKAAVNSLE